MDALTIFTENLVGFISVMVVVLSAFIEITPIKINPISKFFGWIAGKINKKVIDKFDDLDEKVDKLESTIESIQDEAGETRAISCRTRILTFGDEIRRGIQHSEDSFDQILDDITDYEKYCSEHPEFKNNKTVLTQEKIKEVYKKCFDENSFI